VWVYIHGERSKTGRHGTRGERGLLPFNRLTSVIGMLPEYAYFLDRKAILQAYFLDRYNSLTGLLPE
jgi:hypothetical protein